MVTSSALLTPGHWDCILVGKAIDLSSPAGTPGSWFLPTMITTSVFIDIIIVYCYNSRRSVKKSQSIAKYSQQIISNTEKKV